MLSALLLLTILCLCTHSYSLLWEETSSLYRDMVSEERWESRKENNISDVNDLVSRVRSHDWLSIDSSLNARHFTQFSLVALSRCGFGNHLPWKSEESSSDAMASFGSALETVSKSFIVRLMIPKWMYLLPIEGQVNLCKVVNDTLTDLQPIASAKSTRHFVISMNISRCSCDNERRMSIRRSEISSA